jgi:hypothetical protein
MNSFLFHERDDGRILEPASVDHLVPSKMDVGVRVFCRELLDDGCDHVEHLTRLLEGGGKRKRESGKEERRKEEEVRRNEEDGREKEEGGRGKEEGGRRTEEKGKRPFLWQD